MSTRDKPRTITDLVADQAEQLRGLRAQLQSLLGQQVRLGRATTAATPGSVIGRVEVFDPATGLSLGFLALYDSIA